MVGIPNLGNTCYFNSALQCLLHVPQLTNFFIQFDYKGECEFTREYQKIVRDAWVNVDIKILNPEPILHLFRLRFGQFNNKNPNDAQEALLCMLEFLEPYTKSIINGKMLQETICKSGKTCQNVDTTIITIPPFDILEKSLKSLVDWNTIENYIDSYDKVWHVAASRIFFVNTPKILILSMTCKMNIKIDENIKINDILYTLFATSIHMGNQNGGHYIAYTKHNDIWYLNDDEMCIKADLPLESGHNILFYKTITD